MTRLFPSQEVRRKEVWSVSSDPSGDKDYNVLPFTPPTKGLKHVVDRIC